MAYPKYAKALRVSMNGVSFGGGRRRAAMAWNKAKGQGAVPGEADIVILVPRGGYGALVVEHKGQGMNRKLSEEQIEYLGFHNLIGNRAESTRGLDELIAVVDDYLKGPVHEAKGTSGAGPRDRGKASGDSRERDRGDDGGKQGDAESDHSAPRSGGRH